MKVLVISTPEDPLGYPLARAFYESFVALGNQVDLYDHYKPGYDVCLIMWACQRHDLPKDKTYKIAYNWEDLRMKIWQKRIHRNMKVFNCILDYNIENLQVRLPIKHLSCPIGYHSSFELASIKNEHHKVAFLGHVAPINSIDRFRGGLQPYRAETIKKIEDDLKINIWCARSKEERIHSENLRKILFNTDIHLNIHSIPQGSLFESHRIMMLLLSNRCFIISQPNQNCPLISGQHYIETKDLTSSIRYYLEHSEERNQISTQGYEFIKKNFRLQEHLDKCLGQI